MVSCRATLFPERSSLPRLSLLTCDGSYASHLASGTLEELMAERGLSVDHTTIWRWTQTYAPEVLRRLRGQVK
jgi:transposase-like protein